MTHNNRSLFNHPNIRCPKKLLLRARPEIPPLTLKVPLVLYDIIYRFLI